MHMQYQEQRGNVIFMILLAVVMIGYLTVAVMNSGTSDSVQVDDEIFAVKASQIRGYFGTLERGVNYMLQNGASPSQIRFAHPRADNDYGDLSSAPDVTVQMFAPEGGGAPYRRAPSDITEGEAWEFYGTSAAPAVGSGEADLMVVLPNVRADFCAYFNQINGQPDVLNDTGACVDAGAAGRFSDSTQFSSSPNTFEEAGFTQDSVRSIVAPAPQACVYCGSDAQYHIYHVLYAR